jgi:multidrug resistance efflux pump
MEILLLIVYSFFVWLIFFKFRWLPWNFVSQMVVSILPLVGLTVMILLLNIVAPSSHDVRVINHVVQVLPQVRGRVIEVPVEGNRPVKAGDVLFRVDPAPFEMEVRRIAAQLVLAQVRLKQSSVLVQKGAGSALDFERDQSDVRQLKAQLDQAEWDLSQTVVTAPANGTVINLQLRKGSYVTSMPLAPVMSFVENTQWIIALFRQNELREVQPGNEAELAMEVYPGRIIKARVESVIWATGQGQLPMGGIIPQTGAQPMPEGRFAVKMALDEHDKDLFMAAGARGSCAIFTERLRMIHILRKVIIRVSAKLDWFVLKLH